MNSKFNKLLTFILVIIILFYIVYWGNPEQIIINEHNLKVNNWNPDLNGFKIVLISDLHIGTKHVPLKKLKKIVNIANEQKADAIFILGDFDAMSISYSKIPQKDISKTLSNLKNSYAILGNHDYEPCATVQPILKSAGIKLLKNESVWIYFNNKKIRICGIEDIWHENIDVKKVVGKINEPTIFLTHNPDSFPLVPDEVSLTLAGHTHGGEISFPILGAPFVPSVYGQKYTKGHIIENNKQMYVTSGIASLSRFRLFNPPEIVILKIYSDNSPQKDKTSVGLFHKFIFNYNKNKYGKLLHCH